MIPYLSSEIEDYILDFNQEDYSSPMNEILERFQKKFQKIFLRRVRLNEIWNNEDEIYDDYKNYYKYSSEINFIYSKFIKIIYNELSIYYFLNNPKFKIEEYDYQYSLFINSLNEIIAEFFEK